MKKIFILTVLITFFICAVDSGCYAADVCSIHIASYKNYGKAATNVNSLRKGGYPAFCEKVDIPGKGRWYRVYVGKYKSGAEALRVGKKLKRGGVIDYFKIQVIPTRAADEARKIPPKPLPLDEKKVAAADEKKVIPVDEKKLSAEGKKKVIPAEEKKLSAEGEKKVVPVDEKKVAAADEKKEVFVDKKKITAARVVSLRVKPVSPVVRRKLKEAKSSVEDNLYSNAMDDFKSGEYKEALGKFKEILRQGPLKTGKKEKVVRRLADCHYFLAEKGDSRDYLKAVEHYKKIIRDYPSSKENVTALYRLAGSYMNLKFYYEAIGAFEALCSKYPESSYVPESIFEMGRILYKIGNFLKAVERFKEYLKKFPDGKHAKIAFFRIGDCYSQMQRFDEAEIWYRDALKRWPNLGNVPKDSLLNLGFHYFRSGKHQDAVEALFVHMNLYPDDERNKKIIYGIARSFVKMGQFPAALMMSSQLIEKYPESQEALESEIIMANIGVKAPGIRAPLLMKGVQNYLNPLKTYDDMLAKYTFGEMNEGLLYQKGYALWKESRYEKSFDIYAHLLKRFPYGKYEKMSKKNLAAIAEILVDKHYSKGDYLAVSDIYFRAYKDDLIECNNFKTCFSIGNSLKETGFRDDAMKIFGHLAGICRSRKDKARVILAMAEIDYGKGNYEDAEKVLRAGLLKKPSGISPEVLVYAKKMIGDISLKKRLFKKAASAYGEVLGSGKNIKGIPAVYRDYACSLREMNLHSSAVVNYQRAIKRYDEGDQKGPVDVVLDSRTALGDYFYKEEKYKEATAMYKQFLGSLPEGEQDMWSLYNVGRGYVKSGNVPMAERTFTELREKGGEVFWANVVDYFVDDNNWTEKYAKYLKIANMD